MRPFAMLLAAVMTAACATTSSGATASPARINSPSPTANLADSKAVDLRVRLTLLLGEQVIVVAKQAAAAVSHNDEYPGYATLLTTNSNDITEVMRSAFGDQGAAQFKTTWDVQNGYLADYTIGVVTHNASKSDAALAGLRNTFVPQFAQVIGSLTRLPADNYTQQLNQRVDAMRTVIDDEMAQSYATLYSDLHKAHADSLMADLISKQILVLYADKFPGDPVSPAAENRVSLNSLLQEHAYLATMATDAATGARNAEQAAAVTALGANADALGKVFTGLFGTAAGSQFTQVWGARNVDLLAFAMKGDATSRLDLTDKFVTGFYALAPTAATTTHDQVIATLKVIDDQRTKTYKQVADDDRAAAAAMQPLADHIA